MKLGFRSPNPGRSVRAATTGRVARAAKSAANPLYGRKGVGFARDPERSAYNATYNRVIAQEAIKSNRLISPAEKDALIEKYNANNYWYQAD